MGVVEDGFVLLETNDDFAMGAPPGAPGAIPIDEGTTPRNMTIRVGEGERQRNRAAPDVTSRVPPNPGRRPTMIGAVQGPGQGTS